MITEGDVTTRTALNIVKKSGPEARKAINKAVESMERFNRLQSLSRIGKHLVSAATFGGVVGTLAGKVVSETTRRARGE